MKGAFLSTSTSRIAAPFSCNSKGGLNKRLYLPETLKSHLPPLIGHQRAYHNNKYIYFPYNVKKKNAHREKIFLIWLTK